MMISARHAPWQPALACKQSRACAVPSLTRDRAEYAEAEGLVLVFPQASTKGAQAAGMRDTAAALLAAPT